MGPVLEERLAHLERCLAALVGEDAEERGEAWTALTGEEDLLRGTLHTVVRHAEITPAQWPFLKDWLTRLYEWAERASTAEAELARDREIGLDAHMLPRLLRNILALISTAATAAASCCVAENLETGRDFYFWARRSVWHLTQEVHSSDGVTVANWARTAPGESFVSQACAQLRELGWPIAPVLCWTLYWLRCRKVETDIVYTVPVASYHTRRNTGCLMDLKLHLLDVTEGPCVEHPDLALRPIDEAFSGALRQGWERGGQQSVCWFLTLRYPDPRQVPFVPALEGDSLGAAVATAYWLLRRGEVYDPTCIFMARLAGDTLAPVEQVKEKLAAVTGWNAAHPTARIRRAIIASGTVLSEMERREFERDSVEVIKVETFTAALEYASSASYTGSFAPTLPVAARSYPSAPTPSALPDLTQLAGLFSPEMAPLLQLLQQSVKSKEVVEKNYLRLNELPFDAVENFTGREQEIKDLVTSLEQGEVCHIRSFIFGMGGVGKTSLAVEAVRRILNKGTFPDGVVWHRVRDEDISQVIDRISKRLFNAARLENTIVGLPFLDEKIQAFQQAFRDYKLLFVLDNADFDLERVLRPLLDLFRPFSILVTGRRELPLPDTAHVITLGGLSSDEAIALFKKIMGRDFGQLGTEGDIAEICRTMAHLPIAVKLAAYNIRQNRRTFQEYLTLWNEGRERLRLLSAETLELEVSRRNVSTCFELSWEELNPKEQELFRQMGMFITASFDYKQLVAVLQGSGFFADLAEDDGTQRRILQEYILRLDSLSLIERLEGEGIGPGTRIYLHPLLMEFAREKSNAQEVDTGMRRVYERYLHDFQEDVSLANTDYEPVLSALQWKFDQSEHHSFLSYANSICDELYNSGSWKLYKKLLQLALNAAQFLENPVEVANYQFHMGDLILRQDPYDVSAQDFLQQAIRAYGDESGIDGKAASHYSFAHYLLSDLPGQSVNSYLTKIHEGIKVCQRVYPSNLYSFIRRIAEIYNHTGDISRAKELLLRVSLYRKETKDYFNWRLAEHDIAECCLELDDYTKSLGQTVSESLRIFQESNNVIGLAIIALPGQVQMLMLQEEYQEALAILSQIQQYAEAMESDALITQCYRLRAYIGIARGRYAEALEAANRADRMSAQGFSLALAYLHIVLHDNGKAKYYLQRFHVDWANTQFITRMEFYAVLSLYYAEAGNLNAAREAVIRFFAYDNEQPLRWRVYNRFPELRVACAKLQPEQNEVKRVAPHLFGASFLKEGQTPLVLQVGDDKAVPIPKLLSTHSVTVGQVQDLCASRNIRLPLYYRLREASGDPLPADEPARFLTGRTAMQIADFLGHLLPDPSDVLLIREEMRRNTLVAPQRTSLSEAAEMVAAWCERGNTLRDLIPLILGSLVFSVEDKCRMLLFLRRHGPEVFPAALRYRLTGTQIAPDFSDKHPRYYRYLERVAHSCLCLLDIQELPPVACFWGTAASAGHNQYEHVLLFPLEIEHGGDASAEAVLRNAEPVHQDLGFADCVLVTTQMVDLRLLHDPGELPHDL
jgi:tetratricopeptide (TPR) repeat protein